MASNPPFNPFQQKLRRGHAIHPIYLLHSSLDTGFPIHAACVPDRPIEVNR